MKEDRERVRSQVKMCGSHKKNRNWATEFGETDRFAVYSAHLTINPQLYEYDGKTMEEYNGTVP